MTNILNGHAIFGIIGILNGNLKVLRTNIFHYILGEGIIVDYGLEM